MPNKEKRKPVWKSVKGHFDDMEGRLLIGEIEHLLGDTGSQRLIGGYAVCPAFALYFFFEKAGVGSV
jgi:hypothetical protein